MPLQSHQNGFKVFPSALCQPVNAFRIVWPGRQRLEYVLKCQRHRESRSHHRHQEFVMIDLAETRRTILVLWVVSVILDREGPYITPAGLNIWNRIVVFVV